MSGSEGLPAGPGGDREPAPAEQAVDLGIGTAPAEGKREIEPRIYVASLSDYNCGILHGWWVGADNSVEILEETIQQMLAESPTAGRYGDVAEEWAIHDYEGLRPGQVERVRTA